MRSKNNRLSAESPHGMRKLVHAWLAGLNFALSWLHNRAGVCVGATSTRRSRLSAISCFRLCVAFFTLLPKPGGGQIFALSTSPSGVHRIIDILHRISRGNEFASKFRQWERERGQSDTGRSTFAYFVEPLTILKTRFAVPRRDRGRSVLDASRFGGAGHGGVEGHRARA